MTKYENIIPFLQKEYDKYVKQDNVGVEESLSLTEDKIPEPLLKAYQTYNDLSRDFTTTYGDKRWNALNVHNHSSNLSNTSSRGFAEWDFGKAYYKKLTKQQAADLLGMKLYTGSGRHKVEVSADDATDGNVSIELEGNLAQQNINKLRFLVNTNGRWTLTEFEYRNDDNGKEQFFPIYRGDIPRQKFENVGATITKSTSLVRINDVRGSKKPQGLYYMIEISDLIYETDEYEHSLNGANLNNNNKLLKSQDKLEGYIKGIMANGVLSKYVQKLCDKFNLDKNEVVENARDNGYIRDVIYNLISQYGDDLENVNVDTLMDIFNNENYLNSFYENSDSYPTVLNNIINHANLSNEIREWFKANLYNLATSDLERIKNKNIDDLVFKVQDNLLSEIPEGRQKDILTRRVKNRRHKGVNLNKGDNIGHGDNVDFNPYTTYRNSTAQLRKYDIVDTGNHYRNNDGSGSTFGMWFNGSPSILSNMLSKYISLLNNKKKSKKLYLLAYNKYQQLKNQSRYFDNDDEYDEKLAEAENDYLNKKAIYLGGTDTAGIEQPGIVNKVKTYKKIFNDSVDEVAYKHSVLLNNHYAYLQNSYNKLLILRNLIKDISSYTKEDFEKLYGIENKEEFDKLGAKIDEMLKNKKQAEAKVISIRTEINDLQQKLAELTASLSSEEVNLDEITKQVRELKNEQDNLNTGISNSIKKAYKDQKDFNKLANEIDNDIRQYRNKNTTKNTEVDTKKKETDERFLQLIQEFSNENKDIPEEEPTADDILSDEEVIVDNDTDNQEVAANIA